MRVVGWFVSCVGLSCTAAPPTPGDHEIVSVASSFGECGGPCIQTVVFEPALSLTIEDWGGGAPLAVQSGSFTTEGLGELDEVDRTLDPESLEAQYGCPDCADGGAMTLVVDHAGFRSEHTWEFANPPDELVQVDTLFHHVRDALEACEPTVWVTPAAGCSAFE